MKSQSFGLSCCSQAVATLSVGSSFDVLGSVASDFPSDSSEALTEGELMMVFLISEFASDLKKYFYHCE